jgi:hypothetical protein
MDEKIAAMHSTKSGSAIPKDTFLVVSKYSREAIGVIKVSGIINVGDKVIAISYKVSQWLDKL